MRKFRSEARTPVRREIELCWQANAHDYRSTAMTRDISASGVGLIVPNSFMVGACLRLLVGDEFRPVIVRRCLALNSGYLLGLQFDPSYVRNKDLLTAATRHWIELAS